MFIFFQCKEPKNTLDFILVKMLAFCVTIFFFVFFIFFRSIFAAEIPIVTIPYFFYINFALLSSTLIQLSSFFNFLASF